MITIRVRYEYSYDVRAAVCTTYQYRCFAVGIAALHTSDFVQDNQSSKCCCSTVAVNVRNTAGVAAIRVFIFTQSACPYGEVAILLSQSGRLFYTRDSWLGSSLDGVVFLVVRVVCVMGVTKMLLLLYRLLPSCLFDTDHGLKGSFEMISCSSRIIQQQLDGENRESYCALKTKAKRHACFNFSSINTAAATWWIT